jgi:hypothetical protein
MLKRSALLFALVVTAAVAFAEPPKPGDNPGQTPPYVWAPLPPELAPEAKLFGNLPITPKQFLPHPGTSFGIRQPSGFIPVRCRKVYDLKTPRVLD